MSLSLFAKRDEGRRGVRVKKKGKFERASRLPSFGPVSGLRDAPRASD